MNDPPTSLVGLSALPWVRLFRVRLSILLKERAMIRVNAVFDGEVFRPDEPVGLEPNTKVLITIEASEPLPEKTLSFLDTAASLNLEGPSDWSVRFEEYLYGRDNDGK